MKKKIIGVIAILLVSLSFVGCSNKEESNSNNRNYITQEENNYNLDGDNKLDEEAGDKCGVDDENNSSEDKDVDNNKDKVDKNKFSGNNRGTNDEKNPEKPIESKKEDMILRIFYADINYKMYYVDRKVEVEDKAVIKAITEELKNDYSKDIVSFVPKELQVRNATIKDGVLTVDFQKGAFDKLNLGSGPESVMIQNLVNSYGYNLGVKEVLIQSGGIDYVGSHIFLEERETFKVNYNGATEIDK